MKVNSLKISIMYQLVLVIMIIGLGYHHTFNDESSILPLLLEFLFLFIEFILVKIITIKTKFLATCLWTLRLAQIQTISLIIYRGVPLLLQYIIAVLLFNLMLLLVFKLLLQDEKITPVKWTILFGIISSIVSVSFPSFVAPFFVCYMFIVIGILLFFGHKKWNSSVYSHSKNWSYWICMFVFVFNILFLSSVMLFVPGLDLFSGIWQVIVAEFILVLFGILFYNNRLLLSNSNLLLTICLLFLLYWIIFAYIIKRPLQEVLWMELISFALAYIGSLIHHLHLLNGESDNHYNGLSALISEERLKEEFANFLHDDILQDLNAMIQLSRIKNSNEVLPIINDNLERLNVFTRNQMNIYSPQLLKGLSLYENYLQMIESIKKRYPNLPLKIKLSMDSDLKLPPPYDVLVYRWLRELVNNCYKYAQANSLKIDLVIEGAICKISVSDDGIYTSQTTLGEGHGIKTIDSQLRAVGGSLKQYQVMPHGYGILIVFEIEGDRAIESFINR